MSGTQLDLDTVLQQLPATELQRYIFKRLDIHSLLTARRVNKLWQSLIDPMFDFRIDLSDKTKSNVALFGPDRPVTSVSASSFKKAYPKDGIHLNAQMLRITVSALNGLEAFQEFRKKKSKKNVGVTQLNYTRLIQDFYFVEKLHIASLAVRSFDDSKILAKVDLPNLKEVILTFFDGGFSQLVPFLRNSFPNLQIVDIANLVKSTKKRPILYFWCYAFIANHYKTLREVDLSIPEGINDEGINIRFPRQDFIGPLSDDHVMPDIYYSSQFKLTQLTLDKFTLHLPSLEGIAPGYDLGMTTLRSLRHLTVLRLNDLYLKDLGLWAKMGEVLDNVKGTLVTLSLVGCFCGPTAPRGTAEFFCSWVKDCSKLKELEMGVCGIIITQIEDLPISLRLLNLGYVVTQRQIEYVAQNMVNLETWIVPQRGWSTLTSVPRITGYLFEAILHLPKLTKLVLYEDCIDPKPIFDFVGRQQGIRSCENNCPTDDEASGDLAFHIDRDLFQREHSELEQWIKGNRVVEHNQVVERVDFDNVLDVVIGEEERDMVDDEGGAGDGVGAVGMLMQMQETKAPGDRGTLCQRGFKCSIGIIFCISLLMLHLYQYFELGGMPFDICEGFNATFL